MDWKTRFPVGLALLAALMLAGGVSAATSMKLAAAKGKAAVVLASHDESPDPGESDDPGESEAPEESQPGEGESEAPAESEPEESEPAQGDDDQSAPDGSVERFHEGCELPEGVAALEGNWTHGDYVSMFARADDREAHLSAAHSQCGKPMKSAKHGKHGKGKAHGEGAKSHGKGRKHGKSKHHHSS